VHEQIQRHSFLKPSNKTELYHTYFRRHKAALLKYVIWSIHRNHACQESDDREAVRGDQHILKLEIISKDKMAGVNCAAAKSRTCDGQQ
jgi:hypothetical protein